MIERRELRLEMDFIWIGLGIAIASYFIGNGLKNFKNREVKMTFDYLADIDWNELVKQKDVHYFLGITKEDAGKLIEQYPDIPHTKINDNIYYPKEKLRKWLKEIGEM